MKKYDFNRNWLFSKEGGDAASSPVTLPHDAMIHEPRRSDAPGGIGTAYFEGGRYRYAKTFAAPLSWRDQEIQLVFEGVYRNATVLVNGQEAARHAYGYTPFTVSIAKYLNFGEENTVEVRVDNAAQPNSRWYSGSGIYRPVWLLTAPKTHIAWEGIRIRTVSVRPAEIEASVEISAEKNGEGQEEAGIAASLRDTHLILSILDPDGNPAVPPVETDPTAASSQSPVSISIPDARLWSAEHPALYSCRAQLIRDGRVIDEDETEFGIRKVTWSAGQGLMVNGAPTDLKGGCIHHDNGILGACSFEESEMRRVAIMKKAGFNAIRSAHNPCSEALLRACDRLGMYIMDELFDMWYMAKNKYDYHLDFNDCWQEDTRSMVERDISHPSVILYSIGNEVSEPCEKKGVETGRKMVEFIHALDDSRPVTCGTNLMIISRAAKGVGIYSDSEKNDDHQKKASKAEGSQNASLMYNIMATFIGPGMNKAGNSKSVDRLVSPFCDCLDIAGYNYASGRYLMDGKLHPDRVIFGSETFPQDIYKNWKMVREHSYLVGDFMWAGWDYLGEVGIGAWSYTGGLPFARPYPWILAGSGVIDITGRIDASGRYASTVWGAIDRPVIGVRPVNHPGVRPSKSVWRATNAIESWSWKNCEKNRATVEVYGHGHTAELYLNRRLVGKKKLKDLKAIFHIRYRAGRLVALIRDAQGTEIGRTSLRSASDHLHIQVTPEAEEVKAGEIVYLNLSLCDESGTVESNADRNLTVRVEGGELLGLGSANPCTEQRYDGDTFATYYGYAQAVVRSWKPGRMKVTVTADGMEETSVTIPVREDHAADGSCI